MIFGIQINVKVFFKLALLFQFCVASHTQITQNDKFFVPLQYLKKAENEVTFCMLINMKI